MACLSPQGALSQKLGYGNLNMFHVKESLNLHGSISCNISNILKVHFVVIRCKSDPEVAIFFSLWFRKCHLKGIICNIFFKKQSKDSYERNPFQSLQLCGGVCIRRDPAFFIFSLFSCAWDALPTQNICIRHPGNET